MDWVLIIFTGLIGAILYRWFDRRQRMANRAEAVQALPFAVEVDEDYLITPSVDKKPTQKPEKTNTFSACHPNQDGCCQSTMSSGVGVDVTQEALQKMDACCGSGKEEMGLNKTTCCQSEKATAMDGCGCMSTMPSVSKKSMAGVKKRKMLVLYGTRSGTAEEFAESFALDAQRYANVLDIRVVDMANHDPELLCNEDMVVFFISTYIDGKAPPTAAPFCEWTLNEATQPRSGNYFRGVSFAVFGLGNTLYGKNYQTLGKNLDRAMIRLGARRLFGRGEGDQQNDAFSAMQKWSVQFWRVMHSKRGPLSRVSASAGAKPAAAADGKKKSVGGDDNDDMTDEDEYETDEDDDAEPLLDMEDLGGAMAGNQAGVEKEDAESEADASEAAEIAAAAAGPVGGPTKMISDAQNRVLTKQGYKVIGSHSGVKMCRWTKASLRGRGQCYKRALYGIESHRCMEMTPSLACANACVFCWRHHKNPIGKEWKWVMDEPENILEQALSNHRQMIKQMKGVPGVIPARYEEGFAVRHCALSLVGEPIMYPKINQFLGLLHGEGISSFLVTNAQFPDQIRDLTPVTQLYISVDAGNAKSMKEIDRPLFEDFWERFLQSIDYLRNKEQRTVFRLTLVKGWNAEEMNDYATLIRRGLPDFIEVKGVTYCGGSRNELTMKNVPWHQEVVSFCQQLADIIGSDYEVAAEHEHSCCVMLARKSKFKIDGKWYTHIDFDRFQELLKSGKKFTSQDYMAITPSWALFGSEERGFDPEHKRFRRKKKKYASQGC